MPSGREKKGVITVDHEETNNRLASEPHKLLIEVLRARLETYEAQASSVRNDYAKALLQLSSAIIGFVVVLGKPAVPRILFVALSLYFMSIVFNSWYMWVDRDAYFKFMGYLRSTVEANITGNVNKFYEESEFYRREIIPLEKKSGCILQAGGVTFVLACVALILSLCPPKL